WRLARTVHSWARGVAGVVVLAVPVPYDALARGRMAGLVAYAAFPWFLAALLRATGLEPFAVEDRGWRVRALGVGVGLAVAAALAPPVTLALVAVALGLVL